MTKRLPYSTFEFPLAEIRRGYYSAIYFNRTKHIVEEEWSTSNEIAEMQVFQKNKAILCGVDEVLALLRQCVGHWKNNAKAVEVFDWYMSAKLEARKKPLDIEAATFVMQLKQELENLWVSTAEELYEVTAMYDGDWISPTEPVLRIKGRYEEFAHLESVYLGILARATKIATNTHKVVEAARGKNVLFFADRFDRWGNQAADGYAAFRGGAAGVASDSMAAIWGAVAMGTMPHALEAMYGGDVLAASIAFHKHYPDTNLIPLVDFNNDCVADSLKVAEHFREELWGVRLDTSENVQDPSVAYSEYYGSLKPTGVNPMLVEAVRNALDNAGYNHVKIVASGGFNAEKINFFEDRSVPVDAYAVGSSLLAGSNDFTADLVSPAVKVGRRRIENVRLKSVDLLDY